MNYPAASHGVSIKRYERQPDRYRFSIHIVAPLIGPGLAAAGIFSAILAWNEFIYALLFVHVSAKLTLPIHISNYITEHEILWGELTAIGLSASPPVVFATAFVRRYLVRGFAMSLK